MSDKTEKPKANRRKFLKYAGAATVAAAVVGTAGYLALPSPTPTTTQTATTSSATTITSAATTSAAAEKVIIVAVETDMSLIDPHITAPSRPSQAVFAMVYDGLVNVHRQKSVDNPDSWLGLDVDQQDPALAERVDWAQDGLSATFYLRKGVKFHDGTEMTADDMIWTLERFAGWKAGYGPTYLPQMAYTGTEKIDNYTVKMNFSRKTPMSKKYMALKEMNSVFNSKLVKAKGVTADDPYAASWLKSNEAGCGPYYIESFSPADEVRFRAFKDFWRGKPPVDRVIFKFVPDAIGRIALLKAGSIDMISPWAWVPMDVPDLRKILKWSFTKLLTSAYSSSFLTILSSPSEKSSSGRRSRMRSRTTRF